MLHKSLHIDKSPGTNIFGMYLWVHGPGGANSCATSLTLKNIGEMEAGTPFATFSKSELQGLVDQLHVAGFRPSERLAPAPQLEALQAHLVDMRKIAFGVLAEHRKFVKGAP